MVLTEDKSSQVKLPCLVADAAAFLRNVDLENLGSRIFTIREVIGEIRDAATKQRLAVLPYELDFRVPSAESIHFVTEFSKKTGDYKALSAVDVKVLALTYQLEKEFCDVKHILQEPSKKAAVVEKAKMISDKEIAGFYCEPRGEPNTQSNDVEMAVDDAPQHQNNDGANSGKVVHSSNDDNEMIVEKDVLKEESNDSNQSDEIEKDCGDNEVDDKSDINDIDIGYDSGEETDKVDDDITDDDEDDDEDAESGWITPGNIQKVKQTFGAAEETKIEDTNVKCACLTTDFAMQNVLIQMGLHVLSVKGMLIRQARSYVQKCFGCYKETHDMVRIFCPACGNKTLKKVAVTIGEDGVMQYHYPKRLRNPNIRGTKFAIPTPKGGRHVESILLAEDQPIGRNRMPRTRDKANPLDPDYVARTNPFTTTDVSSRAFQLGLHVKQKHARNPNENKKKKSGRKK